MNKQPAGEHQKLKLLYLAQILRRETDEDHGLSAEELIACLARYDIRENRKTLYQDLNELRAFGMDVVKTTLGRTSLYFLGQREFELPELKLLVDTVQSAKFITDRKTKALIRKLEGMTSIYQARQLHRQVVIAGRVKTPNERIYYNVDLIHQAIGRGRQIRFQYYRWNVQKKTVLRRSGWYCVSPWALMWDDENYYMVAFDAAEQRIKHYRVDKMDAITVEQERREGEQQFADFDMPRYARTLFGMYGGQVHSVVLQARNELAGVLIDRFGKDITIVPLDENRFQTMVEVAVSQQFLGWIVALGEGIEIVGPTAVVEQMQKLAKRLAERYRE